MQVFQRFGSYVWKTFRHGAVNGFYLKRVNFCVKNGYVAKTDNPFGILYKSTEIKFVNHTNGTITTSCTKNCLDGIIVKHCLKIFGTFLVSSCKDAIVVIGIVTNFHLQSPAFQY